MDIQSLISQMTLEVVKHYHGVGIDSGNCFDGLGDEADYREGVFVGYRYYDKKDMEVLFPFGYGLSYTTFEYSNLRLSSREMLRDLPEKRNSL